MLLKNVRIENAAESTDLRIEDGFIAAIGRDIPPRGGEDVVDGGGRLALPPFAEPHVHLDTCLTLPAAGVNESGTLLEGIRLWGDYRRGITREELRERAARTVRLYAANGVQLIRSHVDITSGLENLEVLLALREELRDLADIQLVAFPQDGILSSAGAKERLETALRLGADAIGAIPHFEFTREYGVESLEYVMALAEKTGKLVDVHCDETDDEQSRFLETLAAAAYRHGLGGRVTASHTTAMHSYNDAYCAKLFRLLALSGINFVSNPLVNVTLQGRFDGYPRRRGITRIKELLAAGMNVCLGHDDMADPFYPLGNANMLDVLWMGLHLAQMMGHAELMDSYRLITVNGAGTMCLAENYGIAAGKPASLVLLDAPDFLTALRERARVVFSLRKGRCLRNDIDRGTTIK